MGVTIFAGAYLGKWLDEKYATEKNWFTMICTIAAVAISLYMVLKQIKKVNESDEQ